MTKASYGVGQFIFNDGLYADNHAATNYGARLIMTYFF